MIQLLLGVTLAIFLILQFVIKRKRRIKTEVVIYESSSVKGRLFSPTKKGNIVGAVLVLLILAFGIPGYFSYSSYYQIKNLIDLENYSEARSKIEEYEQGVVPVFRIGELINIMNDQWGVKSNSLIMASVKNHDIINARTILDSLKNERIPIKELENLDSLIGFKLNEITHELIGDVILLHGSNWGRGSRYSDSLSSKIISVTNTLLDNHLIQDELTLRRIRSVRGLNYFSIGAMDFAATEFTKALLIQLSEDLNTSSNWNSIDTDFRNYAGQVPLRSDELLILRAFANYFIEPIGPKQGFCEDILLAENVSGLDTNIHRINTIRFEFDTPIRKYFRLASTFQFRDYMFPDLLKYGWLDNPNLATMVNVEPKIGLNQYLSCD